MVRAEHVDPQVGAATETLDAPEVQIGFVAARDQSDDHRDDRDRTQEHIAKPLGQELQLEHHEFPNQTYSRVVMRLCRSRFFVAP